MIKKRLIWHIYPSFVLLSALAMGAVAVSAALVARSHHIDQTERELTSVALIIAEQLKWDPDLMQGQASDAFCKSLGRLSGYRVTLVLPSGTVIGDSERDPAGMDNHGDRDEIRQTLTADIGRSIRYSETLHQTMLYVAVPLVLENLHQGTVRVSLSLARINQATTRMAWQFLLDALIIAVIAVFAAYVLSRRISHPLERIRLAAASFGHKGTYGKLPSSDISEVDVLTNTLNEMADQLTGRISTIEQQHDEQSALLSCMVESVLAVDAHKNLIRMNRAAEKLFHVEIRTAVGKNMMEVIRNADLLELVNRTLTSQNSEETEIYLPDTETYLQGDGSVLRNSSGKRIGAVIVLNDVTRLRRVERLRRDFVADVSHELRTPITSILGFAETLRKGNIKDDAERFHFLDIVYKQSARLQAIVEDLLSLSSIEAETEEGEIDLQPGHVLGALRGAVQFCQPAAQEKKIQLRIACPEGLKASMNLRLLQQAVTNLINNAIKFGEAKSEIEVIGREVAEDILIQVKDQGPGIAKEHQARLFERFYRVDKSRSRKLGGTGLGLAIVKHIAFAHRGQVRVESEWGKGSTFTISLRKVH